MNGFTPFLLILTITLLASCSSDEQTLEIDNGDDVIVNLEILNKKGINKIEFQANGNIEMVESTDLLNYKTISFGFDNKGEGTLKYASTQQWWLLHNSKKFGFDIDLTSIFFLFENLKCS